MSRATPVQLLIPLGDAVLFRVPGHEQTIDEVGAVCKQAFFIDVDPGELDVVRKQYYGAKAAQDPGDDSAGGTMIALPPAGEPIAALRAATVVMQAGARARLCRPRARSSIRPRRGRDAAMARAQRDDHREHRADRGPEPDREEGGWTCQAAQ